MKTRQLINTTFSCLIVALCLMTPCQAGARFRMSRFKARAPKVRVERRIQRLHAERSFRCCEWQQRMVFGAARSLNYQQQQDERRHRRLTDKQKKQSRANSLSTLRLSSHKRKMRKHLNSKDYSKEKSKLESITSKNLVKDLKTIVDATASGDK